MAKFTLTKDGYLRNNRSDRNVAYILKDGAEYRAIGWFGEVYGTGATRREAAEKAISDPRLGSIPRGAMR